jgi:hypothetical protein
MTQRTIIAVAALFICGAASAAEAVQRPSGFEVWRTCSSDIRVVCPHAGIFNLGALKSCMKDNFAQLSSRCQAAVSRYQQGRREVASGD